MPRIASVNQDSGVDPGRNKGAAVHLEAMREAFSRLGCAVIALDESEEERLAAKLAHLVSGGGLDLIYERYALGRDGAARFAELRDLPLVLEVNAPLADEAARYRGRPETRLDQERDHFLFTQASLVLAVSTEVGRYAVARGAPPGRVWVCPNGIDERVFNPAARLRAAQLPGVPAEAVIMGFHGRGRPWHRLDKLAEACGELIARGLPIHLLIVGEGGFEPLQALPAERVTQVGWQPQREVARYVGRFDILPLTHQPDAPCYFSPLKLAEAMACGVVAVVPDLGDLGTTVSHDETGLLYPAGDMDAFVDCVAQLCLDPGRRERIGRRAAASAAGRSWTHIAAQVLDFVRSGTPAGLGVTR